MSSKRSGGFTLIELLVVIAIIGILAAIVLTSVNSARQKAKISAAKETIASISTAVGLLADDTGLWPGGKQIDSIEIGGANNEIWDLNPATAGLTATDGTYPNWHGPYITTIPLDPWGHPYFLDTDYNVDANGNPCQSSCTTVVAIGSFGPDGIGQNLYDSDDIIKIITR